MKIFKSVVLFVSILTLTACSGMGGGEQGDVAVDDHSTTTGGEGADGASTSGAMGGDYFDGRMLNDQSGDPLNRWVIYFDFDSSAVMEENNAMLGAHAAYLLEHPELTLTLEGHADERGTREYNIGLGDRRAQGVREVLTLQGAPGHQINTVSYGEERPEGFGHSEESWRLNRRVVLVYSN
ncbi:peptidoglycan-associated lipoprotein [Solemya pervernicosa gill symbiont]|uniref:Peptidoglycan-associated lipoprotein n=2 Tax=Gammaproteobacteria incertae sedis TaxID=118884 RepID=A0A1T2L5B4_9GAMM|nr:peptidoglycan-associated lipoprotein Pal [Candidatus Reidiella endopervernicosa]OOZ40126.1 peptidoglycan-associated lipoprotein [Solemya pervernicosa gill symbiont]QKQ27463.1 peptidoglycan-associated lipoprotein Pal [Candidatus Reidiella endopervernicosa]